MEIPGVSSMISGDSPVNLALSISFTQSSSFKSPVRIAWESTLEFIARIRFTSWVRDISKLKIAVVTLLRNATNSAIFSTNAVFPIEGLAATRIKSARCRPAVL